MSIQKVIQVFFYLHFIMDKVIEVILYIIFGFVILTRFQSLFKTQYVALFFCFYLFNLLFEIMTVIYEKGAVKSNLIFNSISQSLTSVALFAIIYDLLFRVPEMSESVRMMIISLFIGIITKFFTKYYDIRL